MRRRLLRFGCWLLWGAIVSRVDGQQPPEPAKTTVVLREGTEVVLQFAQKLTSRIARDGEPVELVLARDLMVGNRTVAETGSRAVGTIIRKYGFRVEATALQVGNVKVTLRGFLDVPEMGEEAIEAAQTVVHPEAIGRAYVAVDTELFLPDVSVLTNSATLKSGDDVSAKPPDKVRMPSGRLVRLMLMDPLSSKTVKVGDTIRFQVLDDVRVDNFVVIARKSPATGTITGAHAAGRAWHRGALELQMDSVTLVDHQKQSLQAQNRATGTDTNAAYDWTQAIVQTQGLAFLFLPLAPLQHGRQAILPRGSVFMAETKGEALLERAVVEAFQPTVETPKHGNAAVTIYYPNVGNSFSFHVWCGQVQLAKIRREHKLTISLPPGQYIFRLEERGQHFRVEVHDGGEQYLKIGASPSSSPPGGWNHSFVLVEHDVGEIQSQDMVPVPAKDASDQSKFDLKQLQAEPQTNKRR